MRDYNFEELQIGMQEEFKVKITQEMQDSFKFISGDTNPMHTNKKFANSKGYDDCLVYGMLTASFLSKLVGVYLPGKKCLFQECKNIRFHAPVYVNDTLTVIGEITEIDERFRRITVKATILKEDNVKVCSAKLCVGVI